MNNLFPESCLYGDRSGEVITFNNAGKTCSQVANEPHICYFVSDECCQTCAKFYTGRQGKQMHHKGRMIIKKKRMKRTLLISDLLFFQVVCMGTKPRVVPAATVQQIQIYVVEPVILAQQQCH